MPISSHGRALTRLAPCRERWLDDLCVFRLYVSRVPFLPRAEEGGGRKGRGVVEFVRNGGSRVCCSFVCFFALAARDVSRERKYACTCRGDAKGSGFQRERSIRIEMAHVRVHASVLELIMMRWNISNELVAQTGAFAGKWVLCVWYFHRQPLRCRGVSMFKVVPVNVVGGGGLYSLIMNL